MKKVNNSQNLWASFQMQMSIFIRNYDLYKLNTPIKTSDSQVLIWKHTLRSQLIHPCRCLCLGWDLQKTNNLPRRRTKKQSLQRLLRAVFVFMPADGWTHRSCWHCPSRGERKAAWGLHIGLTNLLNCMVAAVMVEIHLCAPTAGKEPKAAHLATWDNCRVKEPKRQGSNSGAMVSTPSETENKTFRCANLVP